MAVVPKRMLLNTPPTTRCEAQLPFPVACQLVSAASIEQRVEVDMVRWDRSVARVDSTLASQGLALYAPLTFNGGLDGLRMVCLSLASQ
jgi:hypothetical protein